MITIVIRGNSYARCVMSMLISVLQWVFFLNVKHLCDNRNVIHPFSPRVLIYQDKKMCQFMPKDTEFELDPEFKTTSEPRKKSEEKISPSFERN